MSTLKLELRRIVYLPECTPGVLVNPADEDYVICSTLELTNRNNKKKKSCIPTGDYVVKMRESATMKRVSGGRWTEAYELQDVPGRQYILIHPGNYPKNSHGCILVGGDFAYWPKEGYAIPNSRRAYSDLLDYINSAKPDNIIITVCEPDPREIARMIGG